MRRKIVAGNWKMFTNTKSATELAKAVAQGAAAFPAVQVLVCPPFPYLAAVGQAIQGSAVQLGAQNCYEVVEGAFTGEVSPTMLTDVGCQYVILGHSERRHKMGEHDAFINRKLHVALKNGLHVILCVGETLEERLADRTHHVLEWQLTGGLGGVSAEQLKSVIVAYEPVWAIGTGHNATPEQAETEHAFLRHKVQRIYGDNAALTLPIVYGGSMKPENAGSLLRQPNVDGGLIGGASLKADQFLAIVKAAT